MIVIAPASGTVVPLESVPDEVFATKMMGDGIALLPPTETDIPVLAPISGVLHALKPHAFIVKSDAGFGVLVHMGVNTVGTPESFTITEDLTQGTRVLQGDPVVTWDAEDTEKRGLPTHVIVVLVDLGEDATFDLLQPVEGIVAADAPLLEVNLGN